MKHMSTDCILLQMSLNKNPGGAEMLHLFSVCQYDRAEHNVADILLFHGWCVN